MPFLRLLILVLLSFYISKVYSGATPEVGDADLAGPAGGRRPERPARAVLHICSSRPKLVGPEGGFADFVIRSPESQPGVVHLIGIESPGLTAALAIGARVSDVLA